MDSGVERASLVEQLGVHVYISSVDQSTLPLDQENGQGLRRNGQADSDAERHQRNSQESR